MHIVTKKFSSFVICRFGAVVLLLLMTAIHPAYGETPKKDEKKASIVTAPINFFQKYISKADGDRCPMYPSCSHYASEAFKHHGVLKGWVLTCDRLLRCGHDEKRLSPKVRVNGKLRIFDSLESNTHLGKKR